MRIAFTHKIENFRGLGRFHRHLSAGTRISVAHILRGEELIVLQFQLAYCVSELHSKTKVATLTFDCCTAFITLPVCCSEQVY